jgi:aminoglycoside phosphotransferase (APT) family kinase protein
MRARISGEMGCTLAVPQSIIPAAVGLDDFARPNGYLERRLISWLTRDIQPPDGQVAVTHGDFRLDGFVVDEHGRAIAVLAWELSTLGHPRTDLAYPCAQWRRPPGVRRGLQGDDRARLGNASGTDAFGFGRRTDIIAAYAVAIIE